MNLNMSNLNPSLNNTTHPSLKMKMSLLNPSLDNKTFINPSLKMKMSFFNQSLNSKLHYNNKENRELIMKMMKIAKKSKIMYFDN